MEDPKIQSQIDAFMAKVKAKNSHEPEYLQAVEEVMETIIPFIEENPKYKAAGLLEQMVEPERSIMFRVPWLDDEGNTRVNRGYRVQFNSAIGPYKGGCRFHPSVNLSILKFLGFEQIFKNSLTSLPMGGGKGGADFDPKGKSDAEVMRFCQSFMTELQRYIGANTDIPAGDIGVGAREIGYMFGQYKRIRNEFTGVLTGKGRNWGGSLIRPEATGYGAAYFAAEMLKMNNNDSFENKTVAISGSGNVAQFACQKVTELGGKVITLSDSSGYIYAKDGISASVLSKVMEVKNERRGRISEVADELDGVEYIDGERSWHVDAKIDIAMPCATQNEIEKADAQALIDKGLKMLTEGANMPCTPEAVHLFNDNNIPFSPGKASNAGGVATSGLEMSQNSLRLSWSAEEVDKRLHDIMKNIHEACVIHGREKSGKINYVRGANIAGFVKVADAMLDQGAV